MAFASFAFPLDFEEEPTPPSESELESESESEDSLESFAPSIVTILRAVPDEDVASTPPEDPTEAAAAAATPESGAATGGAPDDAGSVDCDAFGEGAACASFEETFCLFAGGNEAALDTDGDANGVNKGGGSGAKGSPLFKRAIARATL